MAVTVNPYSAALVVVYQVGTSPLGLPVTRTKTFNSLRFDADEQAVYDAAQALFALTDHEVVDTFIRKTFELIEEE